MSSSSTLRLVVILVIVSAGLLTVTLILGEAKKPNVVGFWQRQRKETDNSSRDQPGVPAHHRRHDSLAKESNALRVLVQHPKPAPPPRYSAEGGNSTRPNLSVDVAAIRNQPCINADYHATNEFAVWTFLTNQSSHGYLRGTLTLGSSVRQHSTVPLDMVVMQLQGQKELDSETQLALREAGWQLCTVQRIAPGNEQATFRRLRDTFTKLELWGMTQYKGILYMDSDAVVVGPIDELFGDTYLGAMLARGSGIAAARDIMRKRQVDTFNTGVFLVVPDAKEHSRLLAVQKSDFQFDLKWADQGFLNAVYRDSFELPFKFNANVAAFSTMRSFWDKEKADIRIVHYTDKPKPWSCNATSKLYSVCERWINAEHTLLRKMQGGAAGSTLSTQPL